MLDALANVNSLYTPVFRQEEYQRRLSRLHDILTHLKIDVAVLSSSVTIYYFTGFRAWSLYTPQYLCIYKSVEGIFQKQLMVRQMDAPAVRSMTHLEPWEMLAYEDKYVESNELHPFDLVVSNIIAPAFRHVTRGATEDEIPSVRIGVEQDGAQCCIRSTEILRDKLSTMRLSMGDEWHMINLSPQVNSLRVIKSKTELNMIRCAARIADAAMKEGVGRISPGNTGHDIAAAIVQTQTLIGHNAAIPPMVMVNEKCAHTMWTEDRIRQGDVVRLEMAGSYFHYHCPIARTVCVFSSDDDKARQYVQQTEICLRSMQHLWNVMRPGMTMGEAHAVLMQVLTDHGLKKESRIGYSFGIGMNQDWGDHYGSLRMGDKTVIRSGMCLHIIVGCGDDNVEISEAVIVTDSGIELLCKTPRNVFFTGSETPLYYKPNYKTPYVYKTLYDAQYPKGYEPEAVSRHQPDLQRIRGSVANSDPDTNTVAMIHHRAQRKLLPSTEREVPVQENHSSLWAALNPGEALLFHRGHEVFSHPPTPFAFLDNFTSRELGVGAIWIKDESSRMGLGSFKPLGASFALTTLDKLFKAKLQPATGDKQTTIATMTDGNHGVGVAYSAKKLGFKCNVYVPSSTTEERITRIRSQGAVVQVVNGDYDRAVAFVSDQCKQNGWLLVSDQSWDGYEGIPRLIAQGYTTLFTEVSQSLSQDSPPCEMPYVGASSDDDLENSNIVTNMGRACNKSRRSRLPSGTVTHVFLQCGVGGLASVGAVWTAAHYPGATVVLVEPMQSDCMFRSVQTGRVSSVVPHTNSDENCNDGTFVEDQEGVTIMAGLDCGTASKVAWDMLNQVDFFCMAIKDCWACDAVRLLADHGIEAGESGAAGMAGLLAALSLPSNPLQLSINSEVLVINTEGITDLSSYNKIQMSKL